MFLLKIASLTASASVLMILDEDIVEDSPDDVRSVTKVFLIHRQGLVGA